MKKLSFLGIGPRIAIVLLPWLAATITLSCIKSGVFGFTSEKNKIILFAGIILIVAGLVLYFSTVRILMKGLKETKLQTKGPYSLCQNPLYAAIILLIIPALSLLLNSWLVLTSSLAGYIMFRIFIGSEYSELEKFFGEEYLKYRKDTPEFLPFPVKKWLSKN
jgi:protein-S-isoprenylcysteine O-methyltransferase Ste14